MSRYYNPNRSADWNYGGSKFRLSRSKIELYLECPRCFYIDNKLGTGRPRGPAFTLNVAVDALLKKEFDFHRANGSKHPLMESYGIDATPFNHPDIETWRDNFKGVQYRDPQTGFTISGAVDDVWQNSKGELMVVDYKATSKDGTIETLDDSAWAPQYARQMGVYQWLLRKNGFEVSDLGYFVYANATTDNAAFDRKLEFDVTLVPHQGDSSWVDDAIVNIKKCLEGGDIPAGSSDCDFCRYRDEVQKKFQPSKVKSTPAYEKETPSNALF